MDHNTVKYICIECSPRVQIRSARVSSVLNNARNQANQLGQVDCIFVLAGGVNLNCDLTNEPFDFQIKHKASIVVKFGQDYNDEDDEILVLPHGENKLYVDQYIFELIVLSLPPKRIHPGVEDGTLKSEILDILEDLKPKENSNFADPRWEQLKSLKK